MFGNSFMVAPIHTLNSSRSYYLPPLDRGVWRNFYDGNIMPSGYHYASNVAPNKTILFVRSSIVFLNPFSMQHVHDPIALQSSEIRIYTGADSFFSLFEDDGIDPSTSRPFTTIGFSWSESTFTLLIGKRKGTYPGMPSSRLFHIILVRENHGVGVGETIEADVTVQYTGEEVTIDLTGSQKQVKR